jgi:hypothetical protein
MVNRMKIKSLGYKEVFLRFFTLKTSGVVAISCVWPNQLRTYKVVFVYPHSCPQQLQHCRNQGAFGTRRVFLYLTKLNLK